MWDSIEHLFFVIFGKDEIKDVMHHVHIRKVLKAVSSMRAMATPVFFGTDPYCLR